MTKEEIQAKIDILVDIHHHNTDVISIYDLLVVMVDKLKKNIHLFKSIRDLQRRAFEAGVKHVPGDPFINEKENIDKAFENYLYTLANEISQ